MSGDFNKNNGSLSTDGNSTNTMTNTIATDGMVIVENSRGVFRQFRSWPPQGTNVTIVNRTNVNRRQLSQSSFFIPEEESNEASVDENTPMDQLCVICQDRKKNCMIVDCGHLCLCVTCSRTLLLSQDKKCPLCRKEIRDGVRKAFM